MRIASTTGLIGRLQSRKQGVASERFQSRPYGSQSEKAQRKPDARTRNKPSPQNAGAAIAAAATVCVRPTSRLPPIARRPSTSSPVSASEVRVFGRPGFLCDEAETAGVEIVREPFL